MSENLIYDATYGILKYNMFGKKTKKLAKTINVKTEISFSESNIIINLTGIDRNDGKGIRNEKTVFEYDDIEKIEIDEGLGSFNIIMKKGSTQIINDEKYIAKVNNVFILDKKVLTDFYILLKKIKKYGFLDLENIE